MSGIYLMGQLLQQSVPQRRSVGPKAPKYRNKGYRQMAREYLAANKGRLITREELMKHLGLDNVRSFNTLVWELVAEWTMEPVSGWKACE